MNSNITLPTHTVGIVLIDEVQEKVGSLFLTEDAKKDPDTGLVTHGPKSLIGKRVRFREEFGTRIVLDEQPCLWFSDLVHSIYYVIENADTGRE